MNDKRKFWLLLALITAVAQLETVALLCGINGVMLKTAFALLGGLGVKVLQYAKTPKGKETS